MKYMDSTLDEAIGLDFLTQSNKQSTTQVILKKVYIWYPERRKVCGTVLSSRLNKIYLKLIYLQCMIYLLKFYLPISWIQ